MPNTIDQLTEALNVSEQKCTELNSENQILNKKNAELVKDVNRYISEQDELTAAKKDAETNLKHMTELRDQAIKDLEKAQIDLWEYQEGWIELPKDANGKYIHHHDTVLAPSGSEMVANQFIFFDNGGWKIRENVVDAWNEPYLCDLIEPDSIEKVKEDIKKIEDYCCYWSPDGSCSKCNYEKGYKDMKICDMPGAFDDAVDDVVKRIQDLNSKEQ